MPSGKKKRRAIKKKKELEAHHVSVSHEIEDLKSQDEKDGEDGDVVLPSSHGHHQAFLGESEEAAKGDMLSVRWTTDGNKLDEVPILSEEESLHGNGSVETLERQTSYDDSCIGVESLKEICSAPQVNVKKLKDEESNEVLGMETSQAESLIQIIDPLLQEVTEVMDSTKSTEQNTEDISLILPLASAATETAQVKNTTDSRMILESERTLVNKVSPASGFESGSTKFGAKVYPVSTGSSIPAPDSNKQQPESLQSSESIISQANFGLKQAEDTHVTEFSEKQPLIAPAPSPRVAERTSWMNCCGILDLFSGSSR